MKHLLSALWRFDATWSASLSVQAQQSCLRPVCAHTVALGATRTAVFASSSDRAVVMQPLHASVLQSCVGSRTLEGFAADVSRAIEQSPALVRQALLDLVANGLLRPDLPQHGFATRSVTQARPSRISTVGIITADRPARLKACLASVLQHCRAFGNTPRLIVVDGSRVPRHLAADRAICDSFASATGLSINYAGREKVERLHCEIADAGVVDRRLLEEHVTLGEIGPARSALLLLAAGEQLLSVDDDMLLTPWSRPTRRDGLRLGGHVPLASTSYHQSRDGALEHAVSCSVDILREHESLLGQELGILLDRLSTPADLSSACPHSLDALVRNQAQTVLATFTGVAGDAGVYCPYRQLFGRGSDRVRLVNDPALFELAMHSREVLRVVDCHTVSHHPQLMGGCMGLENRRLLPPFLSLGRNEDGFFAAMLSLCAPQALFGQLSYGVVHNSAREAAYVADMQSATEVRIADVLAAVLRAEYSTPRASLSIQAHMARLGELLARLGEMNPRQFAALVTEVVLNKRCRELAAAERRDASPHWRRALTVYRQTFVQHAKRPGFFVPVEFRAASPDEGFLKVQRFCRSFGELLNAWPGIWSAAAGLAQAGRAST